MLDLFALVLFSWLFFKAAGLVFRLTWGLIKISAIILLIASLPVLAACLLFASGVVLLIPLGVVLLVFGLLAISILKKLCRGEMIWWVIISQSPLLAFPAEKAMMNADHEMQYFVSPQVGRNKF